MNKLAVIAVLSIVAFGNSLLVAWDLFSNIGKVIKDRPNLPLDEGYSALVQLGRLTGHQ